MLSFVSFKDKIIDFRRKVEEFKDNHKMASQAVSAIIDSLPQPFDKFFGVVWNGLEKENRDDSAQKLLALIDKFEFVNEQSFNVITSKLDQVLESQISDEDIRNLSEKIQNSKEDILIVISENTEKLANEIRSAQTKTVEDIKEYFDKKDLLQVSYIVIQIEPENIEGILADIAKYLNVQLKEEDDDIPFVPFDQFNKYQKSSNIFLRAPSGYGKSRTIFELIKKKIKDYNMVYVINPGKVAHVADKKISLSKLKDIVTNDDAIIWDNFPSTLPSRSVEEGEKALELITSGSAKNVLTSLHPDYGDRYKDGLFDIPPEFDSIEIKFDSRQMEAFLRVYGENISKFRNLFTDYVESNLDKISKVLWDKDPLPLTVMDYYNELKKYKDSENYLVIDPVTIASDLKITSFYYIDQFESLVRDPQRKNDLEFLLSLKLAYDLKLERGMNAIQKFQYDIFRSYMPATPTRDLSRWIYLAGGEYAMHDLARRSINIDDDRKLRVLNSFLQDPSLIPDQPSSVFAFGKFMGKNFKFVKSHNSETLVPQEVINSKLDRDNFEQGFGKGIAKVFAEQDETDQNGILEEASKNGYFGFSFSKSLGAVFGSIKDADTKIKIFETAKRNVSFANSLFSEMDSFSDVIGIDQKDVVEEGFDIAKKNKYVADKMGTMFGFSLGNLNDNEDKRNIDFMLSKIGDNKEFTSSFGTSLGQVFHGIPSLEVKNRILEIAIKNKQFGNPFFSMLTIWFNSLEQPIKDRILNESRNNDKLALRLGEILGQRYSTLEDVSFQKRLFVLAKKNEDFANEFAKGIGQSFASVRDKNLVDKILKLARRNSNIASGLGEGIGDSFASITDKDLQDRILKLAWTNSNFAYGFGGIAIGSGLSETFASITDKDLQDRILKLAIAKEDFGQSFIEGLGENFVYITDKDLQDRILKLARTNSDFGSVFLTGLLSEYSSLPEESKRFVRNITDNDEGLIKSVATAIEHELLDIDTNLRERILQWAENNNNSYSQFGQNLGDIFSDPTQYSIPNRLLDIAMKNQIFAGNIGYAIGGKLNSIKNKRIRDRITEMIESNGSFGRGFGFALGQNYESIPFKIFDEVFLKLAEKEINFSVGLAEGISPAYFVSTNDYVKSKIADLTSKNNKFAEGFGMGLGREFPFGMGYDKETRKGIQEFLENNRNFASGFGSGFGYGREYFKTSKIVLKEFFNFVRNNEFCLQSFASVIKPYVKYWNITLQKELLKVPTIADILKNEFPK